MSRCEHSAATSFFGLLALSLVVLGWLTLEITNSPFMVGVAMGMRMLPLFFVGVLAGALADRFPRQRLLMLTGAGQALPPPPGFKPAGK